MTKRPDKVLNSLVKATMAALGIFTTDYTEFAVDIFVRAILAQGGRSGPSSPHRQDLSFARIQLERCDSWIGARSLVGRRQPDITPGDSAITSDPNWFRRAGSLTTPRISNRTFCPSVQPIALAPPGMQLDWSALPRHFVSEFSNMPIRELAASCAPLQLATPQPRRRQAA